MVLAGYNEESQIPIAIEETVRVLEECFKSYELILVDDASSDCSLQIMLEYQKTNPNIKVLYNEVNLNFGTSVLRGLFSATGDYVMYNAMDLPLSPEEIPNIFSEIADHALVVLERVGYATTKWRKITSLVNRLLLKILFPKLTTGTPILNYIQIYRRDILQEIKPITRGPIFVWVELVFRAKLKNYKWMNRPAPCSVQNVRKGAFGKPHDIIWGIYEMLRFRIKLWMRDI